MGLSLDTPTVLLGVEFYADPVTERALNTRASILTQVIENYMVSKITGEPYYSEEEWVSLPDNVRQDLEKILKELGVEPHGETNKESSIQELTRGETPEYNLTTEAVKIEIGQEKGVSILNIYLRLSIAVTQLALGKILEVAVPNAVSPEAEGTMTTTRLLLKIAKFFGNLAIAAYFKAVCYARMPYFGVYLALFAIKVGDASQIVSTLLKCVAIIGETAYGSSREAFKISQGILAELLWEYLPKPV
ncbi:hypothetical protein [Methanopyrus kandleri]